jgi:hypothetical protein
MTLDKFNPNNFVVDKVLSLTIHVDVCFCGFKQDVKHPLCTCPKCGRELMVRWNEVQMVDLNDE